MKNPFGHRDDVSAVDIYRPDDAWPSSLSASRSCRALQLMYGTLTQRVAEE